MGFDRFDGPMPALSIDPNDSTEIAFDRDEQPVNATLIESLKGVPTFTGEVAFLRSDVAVSAPSARKRPFHWSRRQWKWGAEAGAARRKGEPEPTTDRAWNDNTRLVLAWSPSSTGWTTTLRLRGYCKDDARRMRDLRKATFRKGHDVMDFLEELDPDPVARFGRSHLPYDYFGRLNPIRTAALPHRRIPGERRGTGSGFYVGLCIDVTACRDALIHSPELARLDDRIAHDPSTLFRRRFLPGSDARAPLHPLAESSRGLLLLRAIDQALAGPAKIDDWIGEPVWKLVREIYKTHVGNVDDREKRRDKKTREAAKRDAGDISIGLETALFQEDDTAWDRVFDLVNKNDEKTWEALIDSLASHLDKTLQLEEREGAQLSLLRAYELAARAGRGRLTQRAIEILSDRAEIAELRAGATQVLLDLRN